MGNSESKEGRPPQMQHNVSRISPCELSEAETKACQADIRRASEQRIHQYTVTYRPAYERLRQAKTTVTGASGNRPTPVSAASAASPTLLALQELNSEASSPDQALPTFGSLGTVGVEKNDSALVGDSMPQARSNASKSHQSNPESTRKQSNGKAVKYSAIATAPVSNHSTVQKPTSKPSESFQPTAVVASTDSCKPDEHTKGTNVLKRTYSDLQPARKISQQKASKVSPTTSPNVRVQHTSNDADQMSLEPPEWYREMNASAARSSARSNGRSGDRQADIPISRLKDAIAKYTQEHKENYLYKIRELLHTIAFLDVNQKVVKAGRMLSNDSGLPRLFDCRFNSGIEFPYDIRADAKELYHKWCAEMFDTDLLRGIVLGSHDKSGKTGDSLDRNCRKERADFHGNGKLQNGQWWPQQLCVVRDGAHGSSMQGIYGREGQGAFSCVMSGGLDSTGKPYPDEDHGDWILYCGTDSTDGELTKGTSRMVESFENKKPVRLIRSEKVKSVFAPEIGFRYDGLYEVVEMQNLDGEGSTRQRHQFKMIRKTPEPMRGTGPEKRPTIQEMDAWKKIRAARGLK